MIYNNKPYKNIIIQATFIDLVETNIILPLHVVTMLTTQTFHTHFFLTLAQQYQMWHIYFKLSMHAQE